MHAHPCFLQRKHFHAFEGCMNCPGFKTFKSGMTSYSEQKGEIPEHPKLLQFDAPPMSQFFLVSAVVDSNLVAELLSWHTVTTAEPAWSSRVCWQCVAMSTATSSHATTVSRFRHLNFETTSHEAGHNINVWDRSVHSILEMSNDS